MVLDITWSLRLSRILRLSQMYELNLAVGIRYSFPATRDLLRSRWLRSLTVGLEKVTGKVLVAICHINCYILYIDFPRGVLD